jgi:hypothetical protein
MPKLLTLDELLSTLSAPVPIEQVKTLKQGGSVLPYIPHFVVADILDKHCVWEFEVNSQTVTPTQLITTVTLKILTSDHGWISRSNVGVETLLEWDNKNQCMREIAYGDVASNAIGMAFRRVAALGFGLGRYLYWKETAQSVVQAMSDSPSTTPSKRPTRPGASTNIVTTTW